MSGSLGAVLQVKQDTIELKTPSFTTPRMIGVANTKAAVAVALISLLGVGCHNTVRTPPPPRVPQPTSTLEKPTVSYFAAEPTIVTNGQNSSLRWSVANATSVQIDNGIGPVNSDGRSDVYPGATTTYRLEARNVAGTTLASVTVTLSRPPKPLPSKGSPGPEHLISDLKDVHFDYNTGEIRPEDNFILQQNATVLKELFDLDPTAKVTIEGYCDERGSEEYNVALGDRRAKTVRDALIKLGVPEDKLDTISFGRERPVCLDTTEDCYARNRRAHFSAR